MGIGNMLCRNSRISIELMIVIIGTRVFIKLILKDAKLSTLNFAYFIRLNLAMLLRHTNWIGVVESRRTRMVKIVGLMVGIENGGLILAWLAQQIRLRRRCLYQAWRVHRHVEEVFWMMGHVVWMIISVHEIISSFRSTIELSARRQLKLRKLRLIDYREWSQRVVVQSKVALIDEWARSRRTTWSYSNRNRSCHVVMLGQVFIQVEEKWNTTVALIVRCGQ